MTNLWPAEITEISEVTPPVIILDQQALMLGNMTKNIVLAEVKTEESRGYEFSYSLNIVAPILDNYRYRLLTIWHDIDLYPVIVQVGIDIYNEIFKNFEDKIECSPWAYDEWEASMGQGQVNPDSFKASSKKELLDILKAIFNANKTKRIISALFAQSNPENKAS